MKKVLIVTGLTKINNVLVGPGLDLIHIGHELQKHGFIVEYLTEANSVSLAMGFKIHEYNEALLDDIMVDFDIIFVTAYPALAVLWSAYSQNKRIVLYAYEIPAVNSIELRDIDDSNYVRQHVEYQIASHHLQVGVADMLLVPTESAKHFYIGSLFTTGRFCVDYYRHDKTLSKFIRVFPHGIPAKHLNSKTSIGPELIRHAFLGFLPDDSLVVWNGGIWDWYDSKTLLEAMKILSQRTSKIKLAFQGYKHPEAAPSRSASKALKLCEEYKLGELVIFSEQWFDTDQWQRYLASVDMGVILSEGSITDTYVLRHRILSYISADVPIVISESDTFSEEVKKHNLGIVVKDRDPNGLADALLLLHENKQLKKIIKSSIQNYKQSQSYDKVLKPLIEYCLSEEVSLNRCSPEHARYHFENALEKEKALILLQKQSERIALKMDLV